MKNERERIVDALNQMVEILVSNEEGSFDNVMAKGICPLSEAIDLHRVGVFRSLPVDGKIHLLQMYRWDKESGGTTPVIKNANSLPDSPAIAEWYAVLSKGGYVNVRTKDLTGEQFEYMSSLGAKAVMMVPVFIQGKLWGIVAWQNHRDDQLFNEDCADLLSSGSLILANTIIRAESERKVMEANERYKVMFAQAPIGMTMFDEEIHPIDCNEEALKIFGITKEYYLEHFFELSPQCQPDGRNSYEKAIEMVKLALNGETPRFEWMHRTFTREPMPAEITLMRTKYNGEFIILSYIYDLRNVKKMEESIRQQEELLRLYEKQRADALKKALAATEVKREFLFNMSHEMRTPLNAITGMATIGKNTKEPRRKDYAFGKIGEASASMLSMIDDMLDMSKIEANELGLVLARFNVEGMIQKILLFVKFRLEEKQHKLFVSIDSKMPRLFFGDERRLTQVIINLLLNAIKFTPDEGKIDLKLSLEEEKDGICQLRFEIIDSGIGISEEQKEKLFLSFSQGESSASRKYGGIGLGLAISKRIIELMDGRVWVESELGKGSCFGFTIKMPKVEQGSSSPPDEAVDNGEGEFAGKNLLLVEDVEINREIVLALLEDTGLSIDIAENGKEALAMVEASTDKYDLVFMDVQMPEMDGLEATRRIRALPLCGKLPIIAMTANAFQEDVEDCLRAGMDGHVGKPLDLDILFEKLRRYLS